MKGNKKLAVLIMAFSILGGATAFGADESAAAEQALVEDAMIEYFVEEQNETEEIDHEALAKEYIPVLMYHHFKDDNTIPDGDGLLTTKDDFEEAPKGFLLLTRHPRLPASAPYAPNRLIKFEYHLQSLLFQPAIDEYGTVSQDYVFSNKAIIPEEAWMQW